MANPPAAFDAARFQAELATTAIGRFLSYRTSVDSTMVLARREADEGAPHGTLVLAEEQTAGRGRRGRGFHSPAGENLYFTLILRVEPPNQGRLPVAVPLAVCRGIRAEGVDARIKWPNDIWVGKRKLSGMLIDAESGADGFVAFPGIGINVNGDPTLIGELKDTATSLRRERGHPVLREALLARICNELEAAMAMPSDALVAAYRESSMVLGCDVVVSPAVGQPYEAWAKEIADDGSLVVVRRDGGAETVTAADVSLRPAP
jgi:BirA family biotin operon repressor/biotin-[acetyl-CoA-carboxylase] ligase